MELALLVYSIDLILKVNVVSWSIFALIVMTPCFAFLGTLLDKEDSMLARISFKKYLKPKIVGGVLLISILIPSGQTIKYMGAAYLIQETFESEFVQETVSLSQKAVIKQLQTWAEDNTDIEQLLESVDIPVPQQLQKKGE